MTDFYQLFRQTFVKPRAAAAAVLRLNLSLRDGVIAMAAMIAVSALIASITLYLHPIQNDGSMIAIAPLRIFAFHGVSQLVVILGTYQVGAMFGGKGTLPGVLAVLVWLEVVAIAVGLFDLILTILLPSLIGLVPIIAIPFSLWFLASFIAEVHGFESTWKVLGVIFLVAFVIALVITPFLPVAF